MPGTQASGNDRCIQGNGKRNLCTVEFVRFCKWLSYNHPRFGKMAPDRSRTDLVWRKKEIKRTPLRARSAVLPRPWLIPGAVSPCCLVVLFKEARKMTNGYASPLEEHTGFEPAIPAWKAGVLPLHQCSV